MSCRVLALLPLALAASLGLVSLDLAPAAAETAVPAGTATVSLPGTTMVVDGKLVWKLRTAQSAGSSTTTLTFGQAGDVPVVGDWDGDGTETIGVARPVGGAWRWYLRNTNSTGSSDLRFDYGAVSTDTPVVGDWDGDGRDSAGVARRESGALRWLLTDRAGGPSSHRVTYGLATDTPVVGNWDGRGGDGMGVARATDGRWVWYQRDDLTPGPSMRSTYGRTSRLPLPGDWDGDGRDQTGLVHVPTAQRRLREASGPGTADLVFDYGADGATPVVGDWRPRAARPAGPASLTTSQLAQSLLDNPRVDRRTSAVTADLQAAAAGRPGTAGAMLQRSILLFLAEAAEDHSIGISGLEDYGTGHSSTSLHYRGAAVDLTYVDGAHLDGRDAGSRALASIAFSVLPSGSAIGQSGCGPAIALPAGWFTFADSCNHLHVQGPK